MLMLAGNRKNQQAQDAVKAARSTPWEFPPEASDMSPAERHGREIAMGYAYAALVCMGVATGDRNRDFTEAWVIGGRLRDLYLSSLHRRAEQP
jgi:hypothetical protein